MKAVLEQYKKFSPVKRKLWGLILALLITSSLIFPLFSIGGIQALEWKLIDTWIRKSAHKSVAKEVAVIGIDQAVLEELEWPLEKDVYADLIYYLEEMGAKVLVFDVLFSHDFSGCKQSDSLFMQMLEYTKNNLFIYTPLPFLNPPEKPAPKPLIDTLHSLGKGFIPEWEMAVVNLPYKRIMDLKPWIAQHTMVEMVDGSYRKIPLFTSSGGYLYPHLALKAYQLFRENIHVQWQEKTKKFLLNQRIYPTDEKAQMMVSFRDSIPFYPLSEVRNSMKKYFREEVPHLGQQVFKDKVVFIGASDPTLGDNALTPVSYKQEDGLDPKVLIHARAFQTLLEGNAPRDLGRMGAIGFAMLSLMLALILFLRLQVRSIYLLFFTYILLSFFIGSWLFHWGIILPMVEGFTAGVVFVILGSLVLFFEKDIDRNFLFDSFKTYLSEDLIADMYRKQIKPQLGGSAGIRTAFFTDIQGFSSFSEQLGSPTKLVELLNEYLTSMTDILMANQGTLDKYEGDAIIAFFGAPVPIEDHAYRACKTALEMLEKLDFLRKKWKEEGDKWPEIVHHMQMRIGINTGSIVTGNMGSKMRMNYTMMGDAVNLAARLESGAKQYGVCIIASEHTLKEFDSDILVRELDTIRVVGKQQPVKIFEILGFKGKVSPEILQCKIYFEEGLALYREQNWNKALEKFKLSEKLEPRHPAKGLYYSTCPSLVFLLRCIEFKENPPLSYNGKWDGIYNATSK